ncbi:hypothetical protein [uncultured Methanobrevibacter sp.]|nr:hypothetical protein [uncultured Methanobrevibacter sp.]
MAVRVEAYIRANGSFRPLYIVNQHCRTITTVQ